MSSIVLNARHLNKTTARERVVLMPCSAGSPRQWRELVSLLSAFEPTPVELTGHGSRERWNGEHPMSLMREAAIIENAAVGGAPFHLVGHSYSGAVALRYALENPHRLISLTLVEPSAFHILKTSGDPERRLLDEIRDVSEAINRGVISGDYRGGMKTFIDYWGGSGSWCAMTEAKQAQLAGLAGHVAHHFWSLIEEPTALADYARVNVPTLILAGTRSPAPSRAIARLLTETLPNAKHRTVRDAGHMSPLTHPQVVNPLILAHLETHRQSNPGTPERAAA